MLCLKHSRATRVQCRQIPHEPDPTLGERGAAQDHSRNSRAPVHSQSFNPVPPTLGRDQTKGIFTPLLTALHLAQHSTSGHTSPTFLFLIWTTRRLSCPKELPWSCSVSNTTHPWTALGEARASTKAKLTNYFTFTDPYIKITSFPLGEKNISFY